jgi:hypothetical protein
MKFTENKYTVTEYPGDSPTTTAPSESWLPLHYPHKDGRHSYGTQVSHVLREQFST